jgi:NADH:ubiquinone oxidoreductase subunit F (NADH-binding)
VTGVSTRRAVRPPPTAAPHPGLPRLIPGVITELTEHLERYGPMPGLRRRDAREAFFDAVDHSGLRGRGGAAFPTGRKLRAVANGRRGAVVVANGAEGEPASHKDSILMTAAPHLVLDGALVAAEAVRAGTVFVVVDRNDVMAFDAMDAAIAQRRAADPSGPAVQLVGLPSRYVAGESSALVNFLSGGPAKPMSVPPRPYERGIRGRPTLVQNVETLANLALIARFGADWYCGLGTPDEPGSVLVTVGGAVAMPGVYEVALGARMSTVLEVVGGVTEPISALLVGGYFGGWLDASAVDDLEVTHAGLARAGGTLGCGVITAFPASRCGVRESIRVARYLAEETAGQCGPCVHGLSAIVGGIEAMAAGTATERTNADVVRWLDDVSQRGACHLPDAVVEFLRSAFAVFDEEFSRHELHWRCTATNLEPLLPLPDPATRDWSWR